MSASMGLDEAVARSQEMAISLGALQSARIEAAHEKRNQDLQA